MIVYDLNALPIDLMFNGKKMSAVDIFQIAEKADVILYDSLRGNAPKIVDDKDAATLGIIDTSTPEGRKKFDEIIEKL